MKKYGIEYSKEAKEDLIGIKQYIKYNLQEPETESKLISKIRMSIKTLKDKGFWVYGTVMNGEDYTKVDYSGKVALIIGNEEKGISKLVKENCDFLVTIPISSKIDSLNASVAAGILIYEVVRSRK